MGGVVHVATVVESTTESVAEHCALALGSSWTVALALRLSWMAAEPGQVTVALHIRRVDTRLWSWQRGAGTRQSSVCCSLTGPMPRPRPRRAEARRLHRPRGACGSRSETSQSRRMSRASQSGTCALALAAWNGHAAVATLLVQNGAEVEAKGAVRSDWQFHLHTAHSTPAALHGLRCTLPKTCAIHREPF